MDLEYVKPTKEALEGLRRELLRATAEIATWPTWLRTMRERRLRYLAWIRDEKRRDGL